MHYTRQSFAAVWASFIIAAWSMSPAVYAALPSEPVEARLQLAELEDVLRRIGDVAAGEAWQKPGWRDPLIEGWLEHLMAQVRAATGDADRQLPVRLADVEPRPDAAQPPAAPVGEVDQIVIDPAAPAVAPAAPGAAVQPRAIIVNRAGGRVPQLNQALIVGRNIEIAHAKQSIILADGNARISFANDCVIVARGAVYVAHGRGNVIVAGHFVHVSHDGHARPMRNPAARGGIVHAPGGRLAMEVVEPGSVIACGGVVDISHAHGTVLIADQGLRVSHANSCRLVDRPDDAVIGHQNDCRDVAAPGLSVALPPHPIGARVRVEWLAPTRGVVFHFGDRRYVADLNKPVTDEAGKPVAELEGWTLSFCDQGYALFSRDGDDFGVLAPAATRE